MTSTASTAKPASAPTAVAADATAATTPAKPRKARTARLATAAADGRVGFLLLRSSGRTRRVPYLAPKSDERTAAVALRTEAKEKTAVVTAAEQGMSIATLRRRLIALDLSEAVDAGSLDSLWDGRHGHLHPWRCRVKVIAYLRVSTDEQRDSGLGLAAQREALTAEATRRGWDVHWIEDAGYSAKSLDRPGIQEALHLLNTGRASALVVAKLDRLSRSLLDFAGVTEQAKRRGWAVVALDLGVDMTTPAGQLMANVLASFAEYERTLISARTRDALASAKARGQRLGRPRATPDDVVARCVALRADGLGPGAIALALTAAGVPTTRGGTWRASTVRRVLTGHALDQLVINETDSSRTRRSA